MPKNKHRAASNKSKAKAGKRRVARQRATVGKGLADAMKNKKASNKFSKVIKKNSPTKRKKK